MIVLKWCALARLSLGPRGAAPLPGLRLTFASGLAAANCLVGTSSHAESDRCLSFRADTTTLEPSRSEVELKGNVEARCGPYRLRSERLLLRARPDSIQAQGPGSVLLCPCDQAPLSVGFRFAKVEESGDLTIEDPTLRVGETAVLWAPWVWLRPPDGLGALPPRLAWRGDGGALLGPGIHVPWRQDDGSLAWMDLYVSGYTRGGFEIEPALVTPASHTKVRFDRIDGDLLQIQSHGVVRASEGSGLVWRTDLSRGSRGRTGPIELNPAARRYDVGYAFVGVRPWESAFLYSGVHALGMRPEGRFSAGPALFFDAGGVLESDVVWEAGANLMLLDHSTGDARRAGSYARLGIAQWVGPIRCGLGGRMLVNAWTLGTDDAAGWTGWASADLSAPLSRRYGATTHVVEPFARGIVLGAWQSTAAPMPAHPPALEGNGRWLAALGLTTTLAKAAGDESVQLEALAGPIGTADGEGTKRAGLVRLDVVSELVDLSSRAAGVWHAERYGGEVVGRASVGRADTVSGAFGVAARANLDAYDARALEPPEGGFLAVPLLSQAGTSLHAGVGLPLALGLRWEAASDWDVGKEKWLAYGSGFLLNHPCGCARARAWLSRRLERTGTDAWISVSLGAAGNEQP